jgi:hypothetical protein
MRTVLALTVFFFLSLSLHVEAQELPIIKDSEAALYVGKNVEVRELVIAVYTSKRGNTFLNFGGKVPKTRPGDPRDKKLETAREIRRIKRQQLTN